jgi:sugar O-acyltransferase (sialic acid O-acetyltransferase NeuD family)
MKEEVIIFGTGDIGQIAHFYFTHDSSYKVIAFTANESFIQEKTLLGLPVIPFETIESKYSPKEYKMFVALSYRGTNKIRAAKYIEVKKKGFKLASYICSKSVYWGDTEIGDNCFIFENQTIQPFVKIGNNVTMWSGNHIGHHSIIEDHCFISSHVVISGHVHIEPYCFLGVNATIRNGITIATDCVIGAGATIVKDTIAKGVYIGNAAELYMDNSSMLDRI